MFPHISIFCLQTEKDLTNIAGVGLNFVIPYWYVVTLRLFLDAHSTV